jgi:citrate lyase beta subunit
MNIYERIYNMLTESTPIGREKSKQYGQEMGKAGKRYLHPDKLVGSSAAYAAPEQKDHARFVRQDFKAHLKKEGGKLVSQDPKTKQIKQAGRKAKLRRRVLGKGVHTGGAVPGTEKRRPSEDWPS